MTVPVTSTRVRVTVRGAHADLRDPVVIDPEALAGDGKAAARLVSFADGRAFLETAAAGTERVTYDRHQVLLADLDVGPAGPGRLLEVVVDGWRFEVEVEPEARAALRERARRDRGDASHGGPASVRAIIPGVVVSVAVAPGDAVEAGQQLLVVEAMKMQNELRAPRSGKVERVNVGERSTIEVGDILVVIE